MPTLLLGLRKPHVLALCEMAAWADGVARDSYRTDAILTRTAARALSLRFAVIILLEASQREVELVLATTDTGSRDFEPHADGWQSFAWPGGCFDTAFRPSTSRVEGHITLHHPTIMAVIEGGCRSIEITSACGHRYNGPDFAGAASFIPPGVTRHIKMRDVRSTWASLSIRPDLFCVSQEPGDNQPREIPAFTNRHEPFLTAMLAELRRLRAESERLDGLYCEAMAISAAQYLLYRYGRTMTSSKGRQALQGWRLRRAKDYITEHIGDQDLRLDDIAANVGLSTGFFHRAFKQTTGETPLGYIQRQRVVEAMRLLASGDLTVAAIALKVGFGSPSHFARLFHRQTSLTPSRYRGVRTKGR